MMDTIIRKINIENIDQNIIEEAASILRLGGIVVFPTETVYGLGADAFSKEAAEKIYRAKGRPSDNPLIVHVADQRGLEKVAKNISSQAKVLMKKFWPGPLTLIFEKKEELPLETTGGLTTVAVREPDHTIARVLIKEAGGCVAAPSANISGKPSPTSGKHVVEDMDGKVDMILDGGKAELGLESTILDMTTSPPTLLRPGFITKEMIEEVIGKIQSEEENSNASPRAPGMKYRHYAPKAEMYLVSGEEENVIEKINLLFTENQRKELKTGIISIKEHEKKYPLGSVLIIGRKGSPKEVAGNLYEVLRLFDSEGVDVIYCEVFSESDLGHAIMNRLKKAASYNIIKA